MARIRAIKPEFWTSERLGTLLPGVDGRQARLLFIALWNLAEDHGVCRGSPVYLRGAAFIYDEDVTAKDVERWLSMLEAGRFIVRYQDNGSSLIWIRGFDEHQKIDRKSKTSLREPSRDEKEGCASPRRVLDEPSLQEGKGREGKGEERNIPASQSAPPEASPQTTTETLALALGNLSAPEEALQPRPEDLQALWNAEAHPTLPRWQGMSDKRRRAATARLRERPLQVWRDVILRLSLSPFCRGEGGGGWRASPDWILQPDVADKVLEGKYDRPEATTGDRPRLGPPAAPPRVSSDRPRI